MNRVLPAANIRDYQHHIADLTLPDPDDRHVLAAAIQARATIILTFNLRDFPAAELARHGIAAIGPDEFLTQLRPADAEGIGDVVEAARLNLSQTAPSPEVFLDILERQQLGNFVKALRRR
jgi:hypothetical protein